MSCLQHADAAAILHVDAFVLLSQDLSDIQWRMFREGLPAAMAALAAFAALSRAVSTYVLAALWAMLLPNVVASGASCRGGRGAASGTAVTCFNAMQVQRWAPGANAACSLLFSLCYIGEAAAEVHACILLGLVHELTCRLLRRCSAWRSGDLSGAAQRRRLPAEPRYCWHQSRVRPLLSDDSR